MYGQSLRGLVESDTLPCGRWVFWRAALPEITQRDRFLPATSGIVRRSGNRDREPVLKNLRGDVETSALGSFWRDF